MDAFTLTDYLLSAILGVLLFMVVIKASDRFLPLILCFVCLPFSSYRAADEQDIVDAVGASQIAITNVLNSVSTSSSSSNFALWMIQSGLSALSTEVTDQGYSLDNIYSLQSSAESYLYNIDYGINSYVAPEVSSIASNLGSIASYAASSDSYLATLANESVYLGSIDDNTYTANTKLSAIDVNTYEALGKLDNIQAAVAAVTSAIEACCYEEMAKLQAIEDNTGATSDALITIQDLLGQLNDTADDVLTQAELSNSNLSEIIGHFEELLDGNGFLSQIKDAVVSSLTSLQAIEQNTAGLYGLTEGEIEEKDHAGGQIIPIPLEGDEPVTFLDELDEQNANSRFNDSFDSIINPTDEDGTILSAATGFDAVVDNFDGLNVTDSDPDLTSIKGVDLEPAEGVLPTFNLIDSAMEWWPDVQPYISLLLTCFLFWHMGHLFFNMTMRVMAS